MVNKFKRFGVHLSKRGNHKNVKMEQLGTINSKKTVNEIGRVTAATAPVKATARKSKWWTAVDLVYRYFIKIFMLCHIIINPNQSSYHDK
jgi:prophage maintenance system killer protein